MKRIVFDGNCNIVESKSASPGTEAPVAETPVVEFEPPKKKREFSVKQYNPHANTADTRYRGKCGTCG